MIGVLKEDTDTDGVKTFQNKYFPFPLYVDKERQFYKELGNRKLHSWNIFNMLTSYPRLQKRWASKGDDITGNYRGEGLLQGGVLLVSKEHGVVFKHTEKTGSELPVGSIESIVNDLVEDEIME